MNRIMHRGPPMGSSPKKDTMAKFPGCKLTQEKTDKGDTLFSIVDKNGTILSQSFNATNAWVSASKQKVVDSHGGNA